MKLAIIKNIGYTLNLNVHYDKFSKLGMKCQTHLWINEY